MFIITKEMLEKADTYMPLEEKCELAKAIAKLCFADEASDTDKLIGFRGVAREDLFKKQFGLLHTFLTYYLHVNHDPDDSFNYDEYASSHLFNQLERYKSVPILRDKVFDLLSDYREFEKLVNSEIYNEKTERNDILRRFNDELTANGDPKKLIELVDELKKQAAEYTEELKKQGIIPEEVKR